MFLNTNIRIFLLTAKHYSQQLLYGPHDVRYRTVYVRHRSTHVPLGSAHMTFRD